jgi:hypothetical protein
VVFGICRARLYAVTIADRMIPTTSEGKSVARVTNSWIIGRCIRM